ncbi:MAG: PAS domain S-box protein [Chlorobiales bacterium]|nr:PAS domain S-box protein [Chlorobiales bacterium]
MQIHTKNIPLGGREIDNSIFALLDSFAEPAFLIDPAGTLLDANSAGAERFIEHDKNVIGATIFELEATLQQGQETTVRLRKKVEEVLRSGYRLTFEEDSDGAKSSFSLIPAGSSKGSITHLFIIVHENFRQQLSEREVQKEHAVYKSFRETMSHSFSILDATGRMMEWNEAARDILVGRSEEDMLGFDGFKVIHPDDRAYAKEQFLKVLELGGEGELEARVLVHGGPQFVWRMIHLKRVMIEGKPCIFVIGLDITERKRIEDELVESRQRFSQALQATHAGVWEADLKTGENVWSDEIWDLYGLERGNRKSSMQLWQSTVHPDDREQTIQTIEDAVKKEIAINIEFRVFHADGTVHWLMAQGMPLRDTKGDAVRYIGTSIDITERKKTEEALKRSEERFRTMFEKHSAIKLVLDPETGAILDANQSAADFYGWSIEELRKMSIQQINTLPPEEVRLVLDQWKVSDKLSFLLSHRRADGSIRDVEVYGCRIDINSKAVAYLILHDVTERRKAEKEKESLQAQLQHAQKMQLVGQLAGGIAHDFNNMLMVILGHTELALQNEDSSFEDLEVIHKAATHSAELTSQLLAFARRQSVKSKVFDLNVEVERMLSILKRLIGEHIELRWVPNTRNALVKLDTSQIDQILANLCVNARDAIEKSGTVTIETTKIHVDKASSSAGHTCSIPGDYITLTVTDTGEGIEQKHLPHIIEPFFTTKEVGKGTGMGLATVYGIVKQSKGYIDVQSKKGQGTSVKIYFPLQKYDSGVERSVQKDQGLPQGKELILLVEDQPEILQLCRQMLEKSGYTVLAALGPKDALQIAGQYKGLIKLLVTDVVMPEMNGSDLFKELQKVCPNLKALFMSGYTADFLAQHLKSEKGVNFIEKPFTISAFIKVVQEILKTNEEPGHKTLLQGPT